MFEVEDIHVIDLMKKIYTTCFITLSYFLAGNVSRIRIKQVINLISSLPFK